MNSPGLIKGKVARILNTREVVINKGIQDGVLLSMRFAILDPKGEDVTDPDTGEVLGSVHRTKTKVEVVRVEDRLAVGRTYEKQRVNVGGRGAGAGSLADLLMPPKYVTRYATLKTDESTWEDLDESESFVKVGDPVEQIPLAEDEDEEV
jgi:hypothetical protein